MHIVFAKFLSESFKVLMSMISEVSLSWFCDEIRKILQRCTSFGPDKEGSVQFFVAKTKKEDSVQLCTVLE